MQSDVILAQAERRLLERADKLVLLVDSSKFEAPAGHVVCELGDVNVVVTDDGIGDEHRRMLDEAGIRVIIAGAKSSTQKAAA
jgi:DeoR family transcriptional regulator, ulaG and ulaABCDEF operon transcriptional repressor